MGENENSETRAEAKPLAQNSLGRLSISWFLLLNVAALLAIGLACVFIVERIAADYTKKLTIAQDETLTYRVELEKRIEREKIVRSSLSRWPIQKWDFTAIRPTLDSESPALPYIRSLEEHIGTLEEHIIQLENQMVRIRLNETMPQ